MNELAHLWFGSEILDKLRIHPKDIHIFVVVRTHVPVEKQVFAIIGYAGCCPRSWPAARLPRGGNSNITRLTS